LTLKNGSTYKKVRNSKASWIPLVPDAGKGRVQKLQCSVEKYPAFNFILISILADFSLIPYLSIKG
jgi:hypothetical protein